MKKFVVEVNSVKTILIEVNADSKKCAIDKVNNLVNSVNINLFQLIDPNSKITYVVKRRNI